MFGRKTCRSDPCQRPRRTPGRKFSTDWDHACKCKASGGACRGTLATLGLLIALLPVSRPGDSGRLASAQTRRLCNLVVLGLARPMNPN